MALGRRHAGGGLVHQQQLRVVGQRDRQLDPLDIAVGQHAAGSVGLRRHADLVEQGQRISTAIGSRSAPEREQAGIGRDQRHLHVLDHGQRGKGLGDLESTAHAELPDLARLATDQLLAIQPDRTLVGLELAVDHVEGRRFARAIGANQREQLARRNRKIDAIDRTVAAKGLAQTGDAEQAHASLRRRSIKRSASWPTKPAMPCGNASTSSNTMPPSMARQ